MDWNTFVVRRFGSGKYGYGKRAWQEEEEESEKEAVERD